MPDAQLLIIGSGPAALGAAQAFRDHDGAGRVLVVTADRHQPYWRPPLSKDFLQGESDARDIALHPDEWYRDNEVEVLTDTEITGIRPDAHEIETADGQTVSYAHLVIATGAQPAPLPVSGGDTVPLLRSLEDATRLRSTVEGVQSAVVVGAGFIGCEAAASLASRGVSTTVVAPDPAPQHSRLGPEAAQHFSALLDRAGVRYAGGAQVESVTGAPGGGFRVMLDSGVAINADLVVGATGVRPCGDLAEAAGLEVDQGRIVVDAAMRTSATDVFAAGDVAYAQNATAGRAIATEHWQDAEDQGTVAGACAAGADETWSAVPGFWTQVGDATVKYSAWGDGWSHARHLDHGTDDEPEAFTIWYTDDAGILVGALTFGRDKDYDVATQLIETGATPPD